MAKSKSGLFLMELIIAICFFAVASAICVQLFASAYTISRRGEGMQMAVMHTQSAVAAFRHTDADINAMAHLLDGYIFDDVVIVSFDDTWINTDINVRYVMIITIDTNQVPALADIQVRDLQMDEYLYSIQVLKYLGITR